MGAGTLRVIDAVTNLITDSPRTVIVATLLVTVLLTPGVFLLDAEAGTDQFVEDVDAYEAQEAILDEFEPAFGGDEPTTQLIVEDQNVLSRGTLVDVLETQENVQERETLRISSVRSPATAIATEIDPEAETPTEQREAVEGATQGELQDAIEAIGADPAASRQVGDDFSPTAGEATAMLGVVTHEFPAEPDITALQRETEAVVETSRADIRVFGFGLVEDEFERVVFDSLAIVVPTAIVLIIGLLLLAYRDPVDLFLGGGALFLTVLWTFGFTGYLGIPFNQMLTAVPVILLAIGIDFGIHSINRYREERFAGESVHDAMEIGMNQLLVAFSLIAGTTVIGFLANLSSELGPIREFGVVAAIGIIFTLILFGIFLPAAKIEMDELRDRFGFPEFSNAPLGREETVLGRVLPAAGALSRPSPAIFLLIVLVLTAGAAGYGLGVDTTFDEEDFLPPEEEPGYIATFPEPMQPGEYTVTGEINFLQDTFETAAEDRVTIYLEERMTDDHALAAIDRAAEDPPDSFLEADGVGVYRSILEPITVQAEQDPEFAALVDRNDRTGDGIPERNLDAIYDELESGPAADLTSEYLADDRRSTRVIFEVESDATDEEITEDAQDMATRYRVHDATATGDIVVFQAVADVIFESAMISFSAAIIAAGVFLVILFHLFVGRPVLGAVNLVPVIATVWFLMASMRLLGIPFNALTATMLAITIGLGLDYAVHISHRFYDEYVKTDSVAVSMHTTLQGTGGALTGTMVTTVLGLGVLMLAVTPILGQFGQLTALSILLAYLSGHVILPPCLVLWVAYDRRDLSLALRGY